MEPLFVQAVERYGIWFIFVYLVFKDVVPPAAKVLEKWLPLAAKEKHEQIEAIHEEEAREKDLQERAVIAQEQIGRALVLIDARMTNLDSNQSMILAALTSANSSLAVLMDRRINKRDEK